MKKILITGANSYIGTSLEKYLSQWPKDYQIDTIDMVDGSWKNKDFSSYDVVFHVAGIAHSDTGKISKEKEKLYRSVNTDLTIETAKKAKSEGVKQFIFMSSAIVYGNSAPIGKKKIITKDTVPSPANAYGDSKLQAEKGIIPLMDDKFKVVVLRPPMIYGEGCKGNFQTLIKFAKKLKFFPYVKNERSMLYIVNLVEFVRLMIVNEENGIFWPQNNEYSNTSELVKQIGATIGKRIILVKGCCWLIRFISLFTGIVNKAFGNLTYSKEISKYRESYGIVSTSESIAFIKR